MTLRVVYLQKFRQLLLPKKVIVLRADLKHIEHYLIINVHVDLLNHQRPKLPVIVLRNLMLAIKVLLIKAFVEVGAGDLLLEVLR